MAVVHMGPRLCLLAAALLAACSGGIGDKSKALKVINEGLLKSPPCQEVPVDMFANEEAVKASIAIPALLDKGYIQAGQVFSTNSWDGKKTAHNGYVFTDAGRALITKPADPNNPFSRPCVVLGHWEAISAEALDEGTDMTGKPIVNVRSRIRFTPRDWVEARRDDPLWEKLWAQIKGQEGHQWMYQLLKSGDSYFYQGKGKSVD